MTRACTVSGKSRPQPILAGLRQLPIGTDSNLPSGEKLVSHHGNLGYSWHTNQKYQTLSLCHPSCPFTAATIFCHPLPAPGGFGAGRHPLESMERDRAQNQNVPTERLLQRNTTVTSGLKNKSEFCLEEAL